MRVFEFIIVIVAMALIFSAVQGWLKAKQKSADELPDEEFDERLGELEARVKVLECIVTDGREDLRRQFEDLEKNG